MVTQPKTETRQFPTHIDIPVERRTELIELLNQSLADTLDLMTQTKQAHWNVKGKDFYQLHLLFDEIAGDLAGFVDLVAERATSLGGYAKGTIRMAAGKTQLPEYPIEATGGKEHLVALVDRFGAYTRHVRAAIDRAGQLGDQATADVYTEVSRAADKQLWFLEAHLQGAE
jgi:starvation-inducible DNA-binding protein